MILRSDTDSSFGMPPDVDSALPRAEFAAWWWQPTLDDANTGGVLVRSLLSRRTAQRQHELTLAGFADVKDWRWVDLAAMTVSQRLECARYFAAVLMVQATPVARRLETLSGLDRQWALSISSIQPLPRTLDWTACDNYPDHVLGWVELGHWVRQDFPALWNRLLQDFDAPLRSTLVELTQRHALHDRTSTATVCKRIRRCWRLAQNRMETGHDFSTDEIEFG